jgi:hypothetical protein
MKSGRGKTMIKHLGFIIAALILAGTSEAANLYTQDFSGSEPPNNWTISYSARPTEMVSVTFTATGGIGVASMQVSTNTNAKTALFAYPGGTTWSNYTMQFTVAENMNDTSTTYHWGVYYPGTGSSSLCRYLYVSGLSTWRIFLTAGSNLDGETLSAGDVIKVYKCGTDFRMFKNGTQILQTTTSTTQGTIYFGLQRTLTGTSTFKVDDLTVDEATPYPTMTSTISATYTESPTISPTPTESPFVTPTPTPIPWYPQRVATVALPGQPQAVCAYNGKIWVTINAEAGKVCEINPDTLEIEHTISVGGANGGGMPQSIHGAFGSIWTGNISDYTMSRVNVSTYTMTNTSDYLYSSPNMITDDGTYIYLASQDFSNNDIVAKIDPTTMVQVSRVELGGTNGDPYGICYTGSKIFVGRFQTQDVIVIDAITGAILQVIDTPITNGPCDIIYAFGSVWIAGWGDGVVWKIDPDTYSVINVNLNFYLPGFSWVIYGVASGGGYIWATDYEAGRLHKIVPGTNEDIGWGDCSMNPQGVAYYNGFIYTPDAFNHVLVKLAAGEDFVPSPAETATSTNTETPTATPTQTESPTPTCTATPSPTYTNSPTPTRTTTPTATPTQIIISGPRTIFRIDNIRRILK